MKKVTIAPLLTTNFTHEIEIFPVFQLLFCNEEKLVKCVAVVAPIASTVVRIYSEEYSA